MACESAIPNNLGPGGSPAPDNCLASHGIRVAVSYQPVSRYWPLQFSQLTEALAAGRGGDVAPVGGDRPGAERLVTLTTEIRLHKRGRGVSL